VIPFETRFAIEDFLSLPLKSDEESDFATGPRTRTVPWRVLAGAAIAAAVAAVFAPVASRVVREAVEALGGPAEKPASAALSSQSKGAVGDAAKSPAATEANDGHLALDAEQIAAAGIQTAEVTGGELIHRLPAPGIIVPSGKRIGRVSVKIIGMIAELRKTLGDAVAQGEVVAVLESREMGDAKSEYLAARSFNELQQTLFDRAKVLWERRIATEQVFLRAQQAAEESRIKLELARQKLFVLGLSEKEIAGLPARPASDLSRQEIRSPIAGRVAERKVDVGSMLGRDNLETELYLIVDPSEVWAELSVAPSDLGLIKEGQKVSVISRGSAEKAEGKIIFISPMLDKDTRSARVVALIANPTGVWRPGIFVTGEIATDEQPARVLIPAGALQTIEGATVVFVRTPEGFEKRKVVVGRSVADGAEILSGLEPGEVVAVQNTFKLKAELGKALAED
jgi:cobalt-zinc-cadmium efflux system membrane fusion protein